MILLDLKDSRPIYEQVVEKLQELMMLGILEEDGQMPSVRSLAVELSINPNTIQRAYGELERRGYIYSVKGRGSFVGSIHKLKEARKAELTGKLGVLAREAATLGISRKMFVDIAGQEYDQCIGKKREELLPEEELPKDALQKEALLKEEFPKEAPPEEILPEEAQKQGAAGEAGQDAGYGQTSGWVPDGKFCAEWQETAKENR